CHFFSNSRRPTTSLATPRSISNRNFQGTSSYRRVAGWILVLCNRINERHTPVSYYESRPRKEGVLAVIGIRNGHIAFLESIAIYTAAPRKTEHWYQSKCGCLPSCRRC